MEGKGQTVYEFRDERDSGPIDWFFCGGQDPGGVFFKGRGCRLNLAASFSTRGEKIEMRNLGE